MSRRKRWNSSISSKWPKPVCCRENAFTAESGSSTRSSTVCRRKPTTWAEWAALPASSPCLFPVGACPSPAVSRPDRPSPVAPGGCYWWEDLGVGRLHCARSCCGPHQPTERTAACTSRVWLSTSAGPMTRTHCVSVDSSGVWWPRYAEAGWCWVTRRRSATRLCRALCSLGSVRGTPQKLLRSKNMNIHMKASLFCWSF